MINRLRGDFSFRGMTKHGDWVYGFVYETMSGEIGIRVMDNTLSFSAKIINDKTLGIISPIKDKCGTQIYQGDLLKIFDVDGNYNIYHVDYRSGCFMADNILNGLDGRDGHEIWETIVWHNLMEGSLLIEVIGNEVEDNVDEFRRKEWKRHHGPNV